MYRGVTRSGRKQLLFMIKSTLFSVSSFCNKKIHMQMFCINNLQIFSTASFNKVHLSVYLSSFPLMGFNCLYHYYG